MAISLVMAADRRERRIHRLLFLDAVDPRNQG